MPVIGEDGFQLVSHHKNWKSPKKSHKRTFEIEAKTFELRECRVNVGAILEIVERAPNLIRTICIPASALRWLKETLSVAFERRKVSKPSWSSREGSTKLEARIITNHHECYLKNTEFPQNKAVFQFTFLKGFVQTDGTAFVHFLLQEIGPSEDSVLQNKMVKPLHEGYHKLTGFQTSHPSPIEEHETGGNPAPRKAQFITESPSFS